jgi:phospholipase/lecithinase/hemolysin
MRLLATLGAFIFSGIVLATPLHNIVVFGDSLSDNGNLYEFMNHQLPPSPPYYKGHFSNGPVWIEHLTQSYFPNDPESHLLDYAFGGAGVSEEEGDDDVLFTLRREISTYLKEHQDQASPDSLFVVWIGANNYLALPTEMDKTIQEVSDGVLHSLQRLVAKGAKHILVVNLPDLGSTPAAIEFDSIDAMTYLSKMHNQILDTNFLVLKQEHPDVEWLYFDMNDAFGQVVASPSKFGFTNVTGSCVNSIVDDITKKSFLRMVATTSPLKTTDACDGYLFFDLVHPTGTAHKMLAEQARKVLDQQSVELAD